MFSKRDLRSRYHHIRVKNKGILETTFRIRYEHYDCVVITFGVTNAPTIFMDYMNWIFRSFLDNFLVIFIEDIFINSRTPKDHEENLRF